MTSVEGEVTELRIYFIPNETISPIKIINELLEYLNLVFKREQLKEFNVQIGDFQPINGHVSYLLIHKMGDKQP